MYKTIGIILAVVLAVGGAWFFLSPTETHHEDEHNDHELVAKEPVRADGAFSIATSFYPLEFTLSRIVGELGEVINVGANRDPHDFRPSTQDILTLQRADLVVLHGAELEPWGEAVTKQLQAADVPVLTTTNKLTLREAGASYDEHADEVHNEHVDESHEEEPHDEHDEHAHGAYDPHTWLDPVLMSETVEHLTEAIVTLDPENAAVYQANAATLLAELATLDTDYTTGLASCTFDEVITSHDAFGYVAARYDFAIHTIAGISTQDLPSAQTLAQLTEEAAGGVTAILLEENNVTAYGETLAKETRLATLSINPIAFAIPDGSDYLTMMRANLETFKTALNCND